MNKVTLSFVWICLMVFFGTNVQTIAQKQSKFKIKKSEALMGQEYKSITLDGAWCWFSDPRAVYHEGKTFAGYVNSSGNIEIAAYDNSTGKVESKVLHRSLIKDDHANPSLLLLPDGKIMVFYTKHGNCCGGVEPFEMFYRISEKPYDISRWSEEMITNQNTKGWAAYCYSNPVLLPAEENNIYLFWRGGNFRPNFSVSSNKGKSWSPAKTLVNHKEGQKNVRPYMKVAGNGKDKIHFAFTDGHPRDEEHNSIYYMYYQKGTLFKANGEEISSLDNVPVSPEQAHLAYDAVETGNKAWIWDVAEDKEGNPVLVYAVFPNDTTHLYYYSKWDGNKWNNYELVNSGKWFPETPEGETEPEPNYSGGIVLDHEDPSIVYLSRNINGRFEIEKWQTKNGGKSWKVYPITEGSKNDNVRPFSIRNAGDDNHLQVLWMNNHKYRYFTDYHSSIRCEVKQ